MRYEIREATYERAKLHKVPYDDLTDYTNETGSMFKDFIVERLKVFLNLVPRGVQKKLVKGTYVLDYIYDTDVVKVEPRGTNTGKDYVLRNFLSRMAAPTKNDIIKR